MLMQTGGKCYGHKKRQHVDHKLMCSSVNFSPSPVCSSTLVPHFKAIMQTRIHCQDHVCTGPQISLFEVIGICSYWLEEAQNVTGWLEEHPQV